MRFNAGCHLRARRATSSGYDHLVDREVVTIPWRIWRRLRPRGLPPCTRLHTGAAALAALVLTYRPRRRAGPGLALGWGGGIRTTSARCLALAHGRGGGVG